MMKGLWSPRVASEVLTGTESDPAQYLWARLLHVNMWQ